MTIDHVVVPDQAQESSFDKKQSLITLAVLSNAAELCSQVAQKLIAKKSTGEQSNLGLIQALAGSAFRKNIESKLKD